MIYMIRTNFFGFRSPTQFPTISTIAAAHRNYDVSIFKSASCLHPHGFDKYVRGRWMSVLHQSGTPQAPPQHEVIKVPDLGVPGRDELKRQCFELRIEVFIREQGFALETEIDDADETATHFLLRLVPSLQPIGTIRALRNGNEYKLSRLVVLKAYRKYRFGQALVLALHTWAVCDARLREASPCPYVRCITHSQIPVKSFYARYGYEPEGDEFEEDGAPHQKMVALLQVPLDTT